MLLLLLLLRCAVTTMSSCSAAVRHQNNSCKRAATAPQAALGALGPFRGILLPVPTPIDILQTLQPVVAVTEEDVEALQVGRLCPPVCPVPRVKRCLW